MVPITGKRVELAPSDATALFQEGEVDGRWLVTVELGVRAGKPPAIRSITLEAGSPDDELTAEAWRAVPFGEIADEARANLKAEQQADRALAEFRGWHEEWERLPGPAGRPDAPYAYLALLYASHWERGSRRALEDLATELGWSRQLTEKRIQIARSRGLLRSLPHRSGVALTPKAKKILKRMEG